MDPAGADKLKRILIAAFGLGKEKSDDAAFSARKAQ
jgi:hypothetical protein